MSGDSFHAATGEFLVVPWGLEWSGNLCSHDCSYCFAVHSNPVRRGDFRAMAGMLAGFPFRKSREARLLQAGVPVLASNHVDPFAGSNAAQFEPIWELCVELGVELAWQTRGAHKPQLKIQERIIRETPKSFWYVSIPMWDDEVRRRIEPHAPTIGSRLDLVDQLVAAGHVVTVGINPLCIEWLPDYEPLVDHLKAHGAWGVWVEPLYFGKSFKTNMSSRHRKILGEDLIKTSGECGSAVDGKHVQDCMDYARSVGLEVFSTGDQVPTRFFEPAQEIYRAPMPYWHQIINAADKCVENDSKDYIVPISKEDALKVLNVLPELDWSDPLRHKRAKHYRAITNPNGRLPRQTAKGFWDIVWNDEIFCKSMGLLRYDCFSYACIDEGDTIYPILDENGDRIIIYSRKGWSSLYVHTPELV